MKNSATPKYRHSVLSLSQACFLQKATISNCEVILLAFLLLGIYNHLSIEMGFPLPPLREEWKENAHFERLSFLYVEDRLEGNRQKQVDQFGYLFKKFYLFLLNSQNYRERRKDKDRFRLLLAYQMAALAGAALALGLPHGCNSLSCWTSICWSQQAIRREVGQKWSTWDFS